MPNQRYELHHRICNLRYGTPVMGWTPMREWQKSICNDSTTFFGTIGKGIVSLLQEFVTGADSFGQLSNGISNSIISMFLPP